MIASLDCFLDKTLRITTSLVFIALVLDVLLGVLTRYVLGNQLSWTEELATFLLVWLTFLGAAMAYRDKAHILTSQFDQRIQRWSSLSTTLLVLALGVALFLIGGISLFMERWESGQQMPTLGIRRAWLYLAVPVCGGLLSAFSVTRFISELKELRQKGEPS